MNIEKLREKIDALQFRPLDRRTVNKDSDIPPEYSRDTGGKILELIQEGDIKFVENSKESAPGAEYIYKFNLDTLTVRIYSDGESEFFRSFEEFASYILDGKNYDQSKYDDLAEEGSKTSGWGTSQEEDVTSDSYEEEEDKDDDDDDEEEEEQ